MFEQPQEVCTTVNPCVSSGRGVTQGATDKAWFKGVPKRMQAAINLAQHVQRNKPAQQTCALNLRKKLAINQA
jgi:hypothetical protein